MFAIYASYRGRSRRRADYVRDVADALANSSVVADLEPLGVEDFLCLTEGPDATGAVVLSLLQAGDFAMGIGAVVDDPAQESDADPEDIDAEQSRQELLSAARRAVSPRHRAGHIGVRIELSGPGGVLAPGAAALVSEDIAASFTLLAHVLARRTEEGREATALLRAGHLQSEAAEIVGISKQAMSQRLSAAGWQAEQAGWNLAVHMLARVDEI